MPSPRSLLGLAVPAALASFFITHAPFTHGQATTTPTTPTTPPFIFTDEIEPNDTRLTATPITFTGPLSRLRGRSTGASGAVDTSADFWNITLQGINPQAITLHRLLIDIEPQGVAPGPQGHTGVILATRTNQTTTPPSIFDNLLQYTTVNSTPARANIFYSINASTLNFDYRITGTNSTTTRYLVNWQTEVITPELIQVPCPFPIGPVTITTIGQGHTTDTQLFVYDAATYQLIAQMDNPPLPNSPRQAELTVNLGEGRYILAIAPSGTVTSNPPPPTDLASQAPNLIVINTPGMLIHPSSAINLPLTFRISSGPRSQTISARRTQPFAIQFYTFTVQFPPPCGPADTTGEGVGPCPDGVLDNNDYIRFIDQFVNQTPEANLIRATQPNETEVWDNSDLARFNQLFFTPCGETPPPP